MHDQINMWPEIMVNNFFHEFPKVANDETT